jgi:hypothetical protein
LVIFVQAVRPYRPCSWQTRFYQGLHLCLTPGQRPAAPVKLGVFLSNSKSRRAKLSPDKLETLADLAMEWAQG